MSDIKQLKEKLEELQKLHEENAKILDEKMQAVITAQNEVNEGIKNNEYMFDVKNRKTYKLILDTLHKDAPWNYNSAAQLLLLINEVEKHNAWTLTQEFDGKIKMRGMYILSLMKVLRESISGKGFSTCRKYAEMMANVDDSFVEVGKELAELSKPADEAREAHKEFQTQYYTEEAEIAKLTKEISELEQSEK